MSEKLSHVGIEVEVIKDSCISKEEGSTRLTTMVLKYPRFIHSEFMTHRVFSRNAASNRALPNATVLRNVTKDPVWPVYWGKNMPGMQAREELESEEIKQCKRVWKEARDEAVNASKELGERGLHKQLCNRLVESFQYITVVVTATEWNNFFELRCHNDAQPEIQTLATMMELALDQNIPQELRPGEWHLPFITWKDWAKAAWGLKTLSNEVTQAVLKTSVARCARISYLNHNGKVNSIQQDIAFTDKLWRDGHLSPFEHQGRALNTEDHLRGVTSYDMRNNIWSGNFKTFVQYRHYGNDR